MRWNVLNISTEQTLLPQKISFKLNGGYGGEYPIDLRTTATFLIHFQQLIDKTYCVISNAERITKDDRKNYQLLVKDLKVGSLESDLLLTIAGGLLALPYPGFCTPQTLWDFTVMAYELATRFFTDTSAGKNPQITNNGDNTRNIIYMVQGDLITYPADAFNIANNSLPLYKSMGKALNEGNFTSFTATNQASTCAPLVMSKNTEALFKGTTKVESTLYTLSGNIISFNKETRSGKIRIPKDNQQTVVHDYPFTIIGDQDCDLYIQAMKSNSVSIKALKEISYTSLEPQIKRLQIIHISSD